MTLNYDCTLGRKLAYSLTYVGYLTYNFYQIKQIIRKIKAKRTEWIAFISLFMGRIGSLAYNLYYISGTVVAPVVSGPFIGAGPCMTTATVNMVLQEHIYNIFMGLIVIGKVFYTAILTDTSKLWKYFFKVMGFETITFLIYLNCEIIFVGFYLAFLPIDISYFNVFYDQVPIVLFMVNAANFSNQKIHNAVELEAKADSRSSKGGGINLVFRPKSRKPLPNHNKGFI